MTILIFVLILAFLILVHEFGHFVVAKKSGMKVEEFGLGFGPRLIHAKKGETIYSINLLPFGGFVKIAGEDDTESKDPRNFASKPAYLQALVLLAGVSFNILSALLIFIIIAWAGTPVNIGDEGLPSARNEKVIISDIAPNSPAEQAGLLPGDVIVLMKAGRESQNISFMADVQQFTAAHRGEDIFLTFQRGKEIQTVSLFARPQPPEGEGALGIALARIGIISHSWYGGIWQGIKTTGQSIALTVLGFAELIRLAFSGGHVGAFVSGPVGIASLVGQFYDLGYIFLLQFTALIAINLAVINLVPFPALDGGRLFFLIIETAIRRPIPKRIAGYANATGFAILIGLIVLVTVSDIRKLL